MRLCYILLSPTFGMHQYTADLANRMSTNLDVHLVTTTGLPRDRYGPGVTVHTPVSFTNSGLSPQSLRLSGLARLEAVLQEIRPDIVHFTGPHLWNGLLLRRLKRRAIPIIHTIHDLDPHHGTRLGGLLTFWNRSILRDACVILLHGATYHNRLLAQGVTSGKLAYMPLLHLFLGYQRQRALHEIEPDSNGRSLPLSYEPFALFFGRLEKYKGVDTLLTAFAQVAGQLAPETRLVLAGPGRLADVWAGNLPPGVELINGLIGDEQALDLFCRCSVVVLPYIDATQSALIAAAYFFRKPVIVSRTGALPEYVEDGRTGFIIEKGHPASLTRALALALGNIDGLRCMGEAGRAWYECQRARETAVLKNLYEQRLASRRQENGSHSIPSPT